MALTPAGGYKLGTRLSSQLTLFLEKLQVVNTPMASFIRKLQVEYFGQEKPLGGDTLDWDRARGGDFRCIAHALYVIAKYPHITSVGTILQIDKWLHKPTRGSKGKKKAVDDDEDLMEDEQYITGIHDTFRVFSQLVGDHNLCHLFIKSSWRVAPVEFIAICLLISVEKDKLHLRGLAEKIMRMREFVRKEHVDIRMNSRVAKTLLGFILGIAPEVVKTSGTKRKLDDALPDSRQAKTQKSLAGPSSDAVSATAIPPPPRPSGIPDRLAVQEDGKKSISGPPAPRPPPSGPAALRNVQSR